MFFKKKPKPEDALNVEQREVYDRLESDYRTRQKNVLKMMLIGMPVGGLGFGPVAFATDMFFTGGIGTLAVCTIFAGSALFPVSGGFLLYTHQRDKQSFIDEAVAFVEENKRIEKFKADEALKNGPPKIPAFLKLATTFNQNPALGSVLLSQPSPLKPQGR